MPIHARGCRVCHEWPPGPGPVVLGIYVDQNRPHKSSLVASTCPHPHAAGREHNSSSASTCGGPNNGAEAPRGRGG